MLKIDGNLVVSAQIQDEWEGIDIESSAGGYCYKRHQNEPKRPQMSRKGKHRDSDICEDEVLGYKVAQFEEWLGPTSRLIRQVIEGVVGLTYATEQHRHNSC